MLSIDEIGFAPGDSNGQRAMAVGNERPSSRKGRLGTPHVTMIPIVSFDGKRCPPFVLRSGTFTLERTTIPAGWKVVCNETGSMTQEFMMAFMEHIHKTVRPFLGLADDRWLVVLGDGASVHKEYDALRWALERKILFATTPPQTTSTT